MKHAYIIFQSNNHNQIKHKTHRNQTALDIPKTPTSGSPGPARWPPPSPRPPPCTGRLLCVCVRVAVSLSSSMTAMCPFLSVALGTIPVCDTFHSPYGNPMRGAITNYTPWPIKTTVLCVLNALIVGREGRGGGSRLLMVGCCDFGVLYVRLDGAWKRWFLNRLIGGRMFWWYWMENWFKKLSIYSEKILK